MISLQSRIFTLFIVLLLGVLTLSFWTTFKANKQLESQQLSSQLGQAATLFSTQFDERTRYLGAFAETAARDFGLIDNLEGDRKSFLIALNNHRKRIDADIAMALTKDGVIAGQLVVQRKDNGQAKVRRGSEQDKTFKYLEWLEFPEVSNFYSLDGNVYQLNLQPVKSGTTVIGWIGFGYVIDAKLAQSFLDLTGFHTAFVHNKSGIPVMLAVSNREINSLERSALESLVLTNEKAPELVSFYEKIGDLDGENLYAVMYRYRSDILSAIERSWLRLAGVFVAALVVSLFGAFAIARSVTTPIKELIAQAKFIAKGNYESKVSVSSNREIKQLSDEFTQMQKAVLSREQAIAHRAYHNPLTNLPNRNQLILTLDQMVQVTKSPFVLLLLNIRRLTEVNDTLGYHVGDEVIKETASRLTAIEGIDLVCHLAGDEFVLVVSNCTELDMKHIISKVHDAMADDYQHQQISLHLQFSIGAVFSDLTHDPTTLLQKADTSMHESKRSRLPYCVYDKEFDRNSVERLQLVNQLRSAIENDDLVLFYQPKLDLRLNRVTHVEALVRWQHAENGLIPPDVFINIAEHTGQMNALTQWVLNEAARQYTSWKRQGVNLSIAVNISAENLKDKRFSTQVLELISDHDLPLDAILLEVTEDAVVEDPKLAIEILSYLRGHGLKISIDDYGTGYSSLAQLKNLPVHELKIDRAFVQHLISDSADRTIVESTLGLAHNLGLSVVAEGVEDEETLDWLRDNECEMAQGYFISRPLPAHELNGWLAESKYFPIAKLSNLKER